MARYIITKITHGGVGLDTSIRVGVYMTRFGEFYFGSYQPKLAAGIIIGRKISKATSSVELQTDELVAEYY